MLAFCFYAFSQQILIEYLYFKSGTLPVAENGKQMDFLVTVNTYVTNQVAGKWSMAFIESHRPGYRRSHSPGSRLCVLKAGLGTLVLLDAAAPG